MASSSSSLSSSFPSQFLSPPLRNNSPSSRCFTVTNPKRKASPPKLLCAKQPSSPLEPHKVPLPPQSAVVRKFYSSINGKELNSLEKLLSKDCIFQDLVYSRPFKGKSISHYLKDLTRAMGKNVRFVIDGVYEGQELTAAVVWHLEWKNQPIPLTKGCSFFKCSGDGEQQLIKEAHVFIESPLKLGDFALGMLKITVILFDFLPKVTQRFLQKPEVVLHFVGMMYRVFLRPMMLPLLAYYANLWLRTEGLQATVLKMIGGAKKKIIDFIFVKIVMFICSKGK
ncbi:uncharacterized protein LOC121973425 [Zingiber officinale]|uniref:uncharacterized protein LOC121973425 n=1 Tax=Zingiber officinale TaxID=94328 RepID=UPI001C4AC14C|nr:uncharacterized protein LOC121973425 [Zingiber officinale]